MKGSFQVENGDEMYFQVEDWIQVEKLPVSVPLEVEVVVVSSFSGSSKEEVHHKQSNASNGSCSS